MYTYAFHNKDVTKETLRRRKQASWYLDWFVLLPESEFIFLSSNFVSMLVPFLVGLFAVRIIFTQSLFGSHWALFTIARACSPATIHLWSCFEHTTFVRLIEYQGIVGRVDSFKKGRLVGDHRLYPDPGYHIRFNHIKLNITWSSLKSPSTLFYILFSVNNCDSKFQKRKTF